jgi:DNA repair exonuclease SbcCD nuclease subunit
MAISFLHAADIHLDSPLKGLERYENAPIERMRGATRRAFERLINLAIEKRVDFVVIAGDLYDGDCRDYNTGLYLTKQLGRLRDEKIPVFIIAGNHDAANKMTRVLRLPENVRILRHDHPETVRVKDLDVAIHGQSFAKAAVTENLAAAYPAPEPGCVNIGLLHTGLGGMDGHERYAPCTLEELRYRRYDYWALGHVHARGIMCQDPPIIFAGNMQGRHVRETGPKGCLLSTIRSDHSIEHLFHRLDQVRWERGRVDISGLDTESDILGRTAEVLDELLASEPGPDGLLAVRVNIEGTTAMHGLLRSDPDRFAAEVRSLATERGGDRLWIEKVELEVQPPRAQTMFDGPIEELLEVMEQMRADPASVQTVVEELTELKRRLPSELIHDPEGPRLSDAEWLQSLLGQVQPFLLDLLVKSQGGAAGGGA